MIVIRCSVNMDVFMLGATPENFWGNTEAMTLADEDSEEAADIFALAMKNNFDVGGVSSTASSLGNSDHGGAI